MFHYSRNRKGERPAWHFADFAGVLQANAYSGFDPKREPGPITPALCLAHSRRKLCELAHGARSGQADRRPFDIGAINGRPARERLRIHKEKGAPLTAELEAWMREERAKLFEHAPVAKAFDYMLKHSDGLARFLDDGRICLTNRSAERALRGLALGRHSWLFAGSDRGGERAVVMYTLIGNAKRNAVDPNAWLADVLKPIAEHPTRSSISCCPGTGK